jgi:hypothetical protein
MHHYIFQQLDEVNAMRLAVTKGWRHKHGYGLEAFGMGFHSKLEKAYMTLSSTMCMTLLAAKSRTDGQMSSENETILLHVLNYIHKYTHIMICCGLIR